MGTTDLVVQITIAALASMVRSRIMMVMVTINSGNSTEPDLVDMGSGADMVAVATIKLKIF